VEISFIHLSDIHFRKTSGSSVDIDADLRNAILMDIKINAKSTLKNIKGILVGGDIAFAGQKKEYDFARKFLKEMTEQLEIDEKSVYCVPGNHDVNQVLIRNSNSILNAQSEIEEANTIDNADYTFGKYITDEACPDLLYKPISEYNDFAVSYGCNIDQNRIVWTEEFPLDNNMKLKLLGMNSCIISSHKDHDGGDDQDVLNARKMVIGQNQIPSYEENVVWVLICHHPTIFWKFKDQILPKLDKRVDVQLYGHMHQQAIDALPERLVINAGATQPVRGTDWLPGYNWITFDCECVNGDRIIKVKAYPRVLSKDRDRFLCDDKSCNEGKIFFDYSLNIDEKRKRNLQDGSENKNEDVAEENDDIMVRQDIEKDIVYNFFELSYVQQNEVLNELKLLRSEYAGKRYVEIIESILQDARDNNCLEQMKTLIYAKL
jgi:predicted phosphodiesterase